MLDRVSTIPGRVKLTHRSGEENTDYYIMERADQPSETGTPLNKETLFSDANLAAYNVNTPAQAFEKLMKVWSVTVPSTGWSSSVDSKGYYTQTVTIPEMRATYNPIFGLIPSGAHVKRTEQSEASKLAYMDTADGSVILYAVGKPSINLNLYIKGV